METLGQGPAVGPQPIPHLLYGDVLDSTIPQVPLVLRFQGLAQLDGSSDGYGTLARTRTGQPPNTTQPVTCQSRMQPFSKIQQPPHPHRLDNFLVLLPSTRQAVNSGGWLSSLNRLKVKQMQTICSTGLNLKMTSNTLTYVCAFVFPKIKVTYVHIERGTGS